MTALAQPIAPDRDAAPTVLIADEHPLMIAGIRSTIERLDDMVVAGEACCAQELTQLVDRRRPDVVIMDPRIPGVAGMEMIGLIRRRWPQTQVVVLSDCDDDETATAARAAGASGYVRKSAAPADLVSALRDAVPGAGAAGTPARERARSAGPELTERERSILTAVAAGMTTAAISRQLWISQHTIKFHLTNIYRKLGVANRAAAVRWALENGLG